MNKKIFFLIPILCLIFALLYFLIPARTKIYVAKPGEIISLPISVEKSEAHVVLLTFNYNEEIFEFMSNECWIPNADYSKDRMLMYDTTKPIPRGQIGTIILKIKDTAPEGIYSVPFSCEGFNSNDKWTPIKVHIPQVTITR